jgi:hypothetical protein
LTSSSEAGFAAKSCLEGIRPNSHLRMRVCGNLLDDHPSDLYHPRVALYSLRIDGFKDLY